MKAVKWACAGITVASVSVSFVGLFAGMALPFGGPLQMLSTQVCILAMFPAFTFGLGFCIVDEMIG